MTSNTATILVVEDDDAIRETTRQILEFEGYSVRAAENGRTGLETLRAMPRPCVVLLDLMMPVMNGWEFIEECRKDPALAEIPVVVLTAFAEKARNIGAKTVLRKPVELDLLLETLKGVCEEQPAAGSGQPA